jgi:hypothetical protein
MKEEFERVEEKVIEEMYMSVTIGRVSLGSWSNILGCRRNSVWDPR